MTWRKVCTILILCNSWLFVFVAGFMLTGIGTYYNLKMCQYTLLACLIIPGISKAFISGFLAEKVYIVWSDELYTPRLKNPAFRFCLLSQLGWIGLAVLILSGQSAAILENGTCVFRYKSYGLITMLIYEILQNMLFTFLFCWPLWRSRIKSPALRRMARMTLIATILTVTVLIVNISVLLGMGGHEIDWVCVTSCVLDVTSNGLIFFWVSSRGHSVSQSSDQPPTQNSNTGQRESSLFTSIHTAQTHRLNYNESSIAVGSELETRTGRTSRIPRRAHLQRRNSIS
ncbi:hypothetical protein PM082_000548 [Marasmius tenuissimus]|nr:hypothetical protein PM082_000548 [Marasmius tenuissimus]